MKIVKGFDQEKVKYICKNCNSKSVRTGEAYLHACPWRNGDKFVTYVFDDVAFLAGVMNKTHFRLIEFAVLTEYQGQSYGSKMMWFLKNLCRKNNFEKITFRCAKDERAVEFYLKHGAKILGEKQNDYEMEIYI